MPDVQDGDCGKESCSRSVSASMFTFHKSIEEVAGHGGEFVGLYDGGIEKSALRYMKSADDGSISAIRGWIDRRCADDWYRSTI